MNDVLGSHTNIKPGNTDVAVKMQTDYPWNGKVKLNIDPVKKAKFKLYIRMPGWYIDKIVPGDLYIAKDDLTNNKFRPLVNGKEVAYKNENGYAIIEREWKKTDKVEFEFPMDIKKVFAKNEVKANSDRMALQRGPLIYCVEGADNKEGVWNLRVPENTIFTNTVHLVLDEPVIALQAEVPSIVSNANGTSIEIKKRKITAIPYYCWANRGPNAMQVWLPTKIHSVRINYSFKG